MRRLERLPTPQGIGVNQTATLQLPLGPTYHRLMIRMKNATGDNIAIAGWRNFIGEIRLMVNGDTRIEIEAEDLVRLNQFYNQELVPGVLPLFLSLPWARTLAGEDNSAYGTVEGMASFTLEMDLKGTPFSDLEVYAVQSEPRPFGGHLRLQRFSKQMSLEGILEVSDLPRGGYNMLGLHVTSSDINKVEVLTNNLKVHESDRALRSAHYRIAGRRPQTGYTHIDFMAENRLAETLPMALNDFRVKLDFTAADVNMKIYAMSLQGVI